MAPTAARRTEGLIVRTVGLETVVFDTTTDVVTALDPTTSRVWESLDGTRDVDALAAAADLPQEEVVVALARLADAGLLVSRQGLSRRALLRGAGGAAVAAPLLTVLASPAYASGYGGGVGSTRSVSGTQSDCVPASSKSDVTLTLTIAGFTNSTTASISVSYPGSNNQTKTVTKTAVPLAAGGTVTTVLLGDTKKAVVGTTYTATVTVTGSSGATAGPTSVTYASCA